MNEFDQSVAESEEVSNGSLWTIKFKSEMGFFCFQIEKNGIAAKIWI